MSVRVETPHGVLLLLGDRCYLEVPGCPHGKLELLDGRQLRGELSVNHAAVCECGYHETHDFEAVARERALSLQQYARVRAVRERALGGGGATA